LFQTKTNFSKKDYTIFGSMITFFLLFGWVCPFYFITGIPCPGCFITRSILSLLQFDLSQAFYYSAVGVWLPVIAIALAILYKLNKNLLAKKLIFITCSIIIIYWLYRLIWQFGTAPFVFNNHSLLAYFLQR
jgi:hypothetical protein